MRKREERGKRKRKKKRVRDTCGENYELLFQTRTIRSEKKSISGIDYSVFRLKPYNILHIIYCSTHMTRTDRVCIIYNITLLNFFNFISLIQ